MQKYQNYFILKHEIPNSVEWLEVPDIFPSLRVPNLENIVKLRISVGPLKDLKFERIANLRDLTLGESRLRNNEFYEVAGKILKKIPTIVAPSTFGI